MELYVTSYFSSTQTMAYLIITQCSINISDISGSDISDISGSDISGSDISDISGSDISDISGSDISGWILYSIPCLGPGRSLW